MINIHPKLWSICAKDRDIEDTGSMLAYMTHREYNKDGSCAQSFKNRIATGTGWAQGGMYSQKKRETEIIEFDNSPACGFKIVGSASRWSTQNKVFRIADPRGFVVEIPTGNLATLLKYCTVFEAGIQDDCVWGREANNHILLPVNSEPYLEAFAQTEDKNSMITFSKLTIGDIVRFSIDDPIEWVYAGRGKGVWETTYKQADPQTRNFGWQRSAYYRQAENDPVTEVELLNDKKLCFVFNSVKPHNNTYSSDAKLKASGSTKCLVVGHTDNIPVPKNIYEWTIPKRMEPLIKIKHERYCGTDNNGKYYETKIKEIVMQEPK
jgi:hypothetical protein